MGVGPQRPTPILPFLRGGRIMARLQMKWYYSDVRKGYIRGFFLGVLATLLILRMVGAI